MLDNCCFSIVDTSACIKIQIKALKLTSEDKRNYKKFSQEAFLGPLGLGVFGKKCVTR